MNRKEGREGGRKEGRRERGKEGEREGERLPHVVFTEKRLRLTSWCNSSHTFINNIHTCVYVICATYNGSVPSKLSYVERRPGVRLCRRKPIRRTLFGLGGEGMAFIELLLHTRLCAGLLHTGYLVYPSHQPRKNFRGEETKSQGNCLA